MTTELIDKLRQIAACKLGDPMPECLGAPSPFLPIVEGAEASIGFATNNWGDALAEIARQAADALESPRTPPTRVITDAELRHLWRKAGGEFHGPNIEHGIMSERKLLPFLRMLIQGDVVP